MTPERKQLQAKFEQRMLTGQSFTTSGLLADLRNNDPDLFSYAVSCARIDQTIVKLRKAGKIIGERRGRTFIWRAVEGAD